MKIRMINRYLRHKDGAENCDFRPGADTKNMDVLPVSAGDMMAPKDAVPSLQDVPAATWERRISVVVPVYNTAPYLDRCLESITGQSYRNLEILLIDDGSTDESGALCDSWAKRDHRIRVIHQQNMGLGMTRNAGITLAKGDAICFIDSDDYILPRTIEKALDALQGKNAVVFGMCRCSPNGKLQPRPIRSPQSCYQDAAVLWEFLPGLLHQEGNLPISSCTGLYDLDFLRKIRWHFPSEREIIAEDVYALLMLYGEAKSVAVLEDALYVYCRRPGSLTRRYRSDRFDRLKAFYRACLLLCREKHYPSQVERACAAVFLDITVGCLKQEAACSHWQNIHRILHDMTVQSALTEATRALGLKKRIFFSVLRRRQLHLCSFLLKAQSLLEGGGGG